MALMIYIVLLLVLAECYGDNTTVVNYSNKLGKFDVRNEQYLNAKQIITRRGYKFEKHLVNTIDGYILTLHRIPSNRRGIKGKQPVYLQHGLFCSSINWVDGGNKSLAFLLSDAGYDVWMGNSRGTKYSKKHRVYRTNSYKFWDFSWHEMGIYDIPASLRYVAEKTKKGGEIIYIGHSMGTTMFFVFSSVLPKTSKLVKAMVALAPVAYMSRMTSLARFLTPWTDNLYMLSSYTSTYEIVPDYRLIKILSYNCNVLYPRKFCTDLRYVMFGYDDDELDKNVIPSIISHTSGASAKTLAHYGQEVKSKGKFQYFDYGFTGNARRYKQLKPPLYNVTKINVPIYLMYARNDAFVNEIDVRKLSRGLTKKIGVYKIQKQAFNHVDFLYGKNVERLVYKPLLKAIKPYK